MLACVVTAMLLFAPTRVILAVLALAMLVCAWEWSGFLRARGIGERLSFVAIVAALLGGAWVWSASPSALRLLLYLAAAWWLVALWWVVRGPAAIGRVTAWISGLCVLVPAGVALGRLLTDREAGRYWVLFVLVLVAAADIGAFFAGRSFGRRRLAPLVSPGKTWEGVAGGLALAAVFTALVAWHWQLPVVAFIGLGVVVAAFSVVGDLTESLLKRYAGVKDSGALIPGHGGLMDRLDSVMAAAPLVLLGLLIILPSELAP